MSEFEKLRIKDYQYWSIFLNPNQTYLGRCVVWCNREDALDLTDATHEERNELFEILDELRGVFVKSFGADWYNWAFLGNSTRHLHCHAIPRYATEKTFAGVVFKDERYGHSYRTNHDFVVPENVLMEIKKVIAEALG